MFSVSYKDELLPMFDEYGMPDNYLLGGSWANFGFRVNKPCVLDDVDKLKKGLKRYTIFWAYKNNIDLSKAEFKIIMKNVRAPFEWEKDLLKNNINSPWIEVGTAFLDSETGQLKFEINE